MNWNNVVMYRSSNQRSVLDIKPLLNLWNEDEKSITYKGKLQFLITEFTNGAAFGKFYLSKNDAKHLFYLLLEEKFEVSEKKVYYGGSKNSSQFNIKEDIIGRIFTVERTKEEQYRFTIETGEGKQMPNGHIQLIEVETKVSRYMLKDEVEKMALECLDYIRTEELYAISQGKPLFTQIKNPLTKDGEQSKEVFELIDGIKNGTMTVGAAIKKFHEEKQNEEFNFSEIKEEITQDKEFAQLGQEEYEENDNTSNIISIENSNQFVIGLKEGKNKYNFFLYGNKPEKEMIIRLKQDYSFSLTKEEAELFLKAYDEKEITLGNPYTVKKEKDRFIIEKEEEGFILKVIENSFFFEGIYLAESDMNVFIKTLYTFLRGKEVIQTNLPSVYEQIQQKDRVKGIEKTKELFLKLSYQEAEHVALTLEELLKTYLLQPDEIPLTKEELAHILTHTEEINKIAAGLKISNEYR